MGFWGRASAAALIAGLALACVAGTDAMYNGRSFFRQGAPTLFDAYFIGRMVVSAVLGGALVVAIYRARDASSVMATGAWGGAGGAPAALASVILAAGLGVTLLLDPATFSWLAREDSLAETASAFLLLGGCATLLWAASVLWRNGKGRRAGIVPAILLAGLLFLIGMEELSWMQRLLDVKTPEWLKEINDQQETNFHNTATFAAEVSYYLGGFVVLALVPFVMDAAPRTRLSLRYAAFDAGRFVVVAGAMTTMFSAKFWDIQLAQVAFFGSIAGLVVYALLLARARRFGEVALFVFAALVLVVIGPATLISHPTMVRGWDDTEIKEFLLAFGLAFYAIQTSRRLALQDVAGASENAPATGRSAQQEQKAEGMVAAE